MEEKQDGDKNIDDVMMPGFRFHPTDEELVGFYLRRKIQQRTLPIELIKQVDIYKYDPWDLPKLSSTGEKEWYFYCPRDRKYRNSSRPNRVTGAGFWKATGTDRPIYSSDGTKCIGLKKSLVFYRGRAAKGMKTDWMMHEFRLPSLSEPSPPPPKKILDRGLPANEAWAICRIFKKTNSMAQRAQLSHSWNMHPFPETQFSPDLENISCTTEIGSSFRICSNNDLPPPPQQQQQPSSPSFPALDIPPYKPYLSPTSSNGDLHNNFIFSNTDPSSMVMTHHAVPYEGQHYGFSINFPQEMQSNLGSGQHQQQEEETGLRKNPSEIPDCNNNNWGPMRSIGFPFSLAPNQSNPPWDSSTSPSVMSTTYSTNKCYT